MEYYIIAVVIAAFIIGVAVGKLNTMASARRFVDDMINDKDHGMSSMARMWYEEGAMALVEEMYGTTLDWDCTTKELD